MSRKSVNLFFFFPIPQPTIECSGNQVKSEPKIYVICLSFVQLNNIELLNGLIPITPPANPKSDVLEILHDETTNLFPEDNEIIALFLSSRSE